MLAQTGSLTTSTSAVSGEDRLTIMLNEALQFLTAAHAITTAKNNSSDNTAAHGDTGDCDLGHISGSGDTSLPRTLARTISKD